MDPVCGMSVTDHSPHRARHGGNDHFFCSAGCLRKFIANPSRYVDSQETHDAPAPSPLTTAASTTIYTCPMHPQIRQAGPGSCPICGMALEPEMPAATEDNSELDAVKRKFWIATALSVPVVALAMLPHLLDLHLSAGTAQTLRYCELLLTLPVVLWAGLDYYRRGWRGVLNRSPNMYTLIGLGVLVAYSYSLFATFAPAFLSAGNARCARHGGRLLRSGRGHHRARVAGRMARACRAWTHQSRHPAVARARAKDRAAHSHRRRRGRRSPRSAGHRRSRARASGRKGAG